MCYLCSLSWSCCTRLKPTETSAQGDWKWNQWCLISATDPASCLIESPERCLLQRKQDNETSRVMKHKPDPSRYISHDNVGEINTWKWTHSNSGQTSTFLINIGYWVDSTWGIDAWRCLLYKGCALPDIESSYQGYSHIYEKWAVSWKRCKKSSQLPSNMDRKYMRFSLTAFSVTLCNIKRWNEWFMGYISHPCKPYI